MWIITGCAAISTSKSSHKNTTEENTLQLQETIDQKNIEINNLNNLIKEKDAKIKELKDKLNTFGVFE